ncbi:MAG: signal peptide peptidase SppA [Crocinitomicaceae bacterium]|nr:signal peptide peptidase SppA [Crocinitomicaceae bacterium]
MSTNHRSFWKYFWPSLTANFASSFLRFFMLFFFVILIVIISALFGGEEKIKENTILHLTLDGGIGEQTDINLDPMSFSVHGKTGLSNLLYGFEKAKKDENIKGIFLEIKNVDFGYATARSIRNAIDDFEKSGKFVVAYNSGEYISQKAYYISSAANSNYGFPSSTMAFNGLGAEISYFKNTLDKLNVEVEIIRGKNNDFKSAVEPFFRTSMSDSSRVQIERYMHCMWKDICTEIAIDTKTNVKKLNTIADSLYVKRATDAIQFNLLDGTKYRDEIMSILAKKASLKNATEINFYPFEKYARDQFKKDQIEIQEDEPNIAVIIAEGQISTNGNGMSSENICNLFREARDNKSIKTIVFRINSPGGSALASDEIWREVILTNKSKKVIVSMGDVAASGGYYVAAPASCIFAEPTTITGSIGVFGMIPYTGKMFENLLGITFDRAQTNNHSVISTNKKLSPKELQILQEEVDNTYDQFLQRVADGRNMSKKQVNEIARGRVWTGRDALRIGLVDKLGGLKEAIAYAKKKAGIKNSKIIYYPKSKENKLFDLLEEINDEKNIKVKSLYSNDLPADLIKYYKQIKKIEEIKGIQMRLPYDIQIN